MFAAILILYTILCHFLIDRAGCSSPRLLAEDLDPLMYECLLLSMNDLLPNLTDVILHDCLCYMVSAFLLKR